MAVMEAIQTIYLEADTAIVEITSIPSTYQHLQLQISGRSTAGDVGFEIVYFQFGTGGSAADNSDFYSRHYQRGSGTYTPSAYFYADTGFISPARLVKAAEYGGNYSPSTMDIMNYSNTNMNTALTFISYAPSSETNREVGFGSSLWRKTPVVDRIKIALAASWVRGSSFNLYGWNDS